MVASLRYTAGFALAAVVSLATVSAQAPASPFQIPGAGTLEGVPTIRIDSNAATTTRREVAAQEALKNSLRLRVRDGKVFWASRNDVPLTVSSSGAFTYLTSEPGSYIRLTKLNDKISYVEHVDLKEHGSVTWWGELRLVVGP